MANPPPVDSAVDTQGVKLNTVWTQWFNYLASVIVFIVNYTQRSKQVPVNGFSITILDGTQVLQLVPTGTLASGAVTMTATPSNGQVAEILSTQTITSFTLSPNTGQSLFNAPTTLLAGSGVAFYYSADDAAWYRRW